MSKWQSETYEVWCNGMLVGKHRSEAAAIKHAKALHDDNASVGRREVSGSYHATQQVWPTLGPIYTR